MMTHCRLLLLLKHKEDITHKKTTKKTKKKEGTYFQAPTFALSLLAPISTLLFQMFSHGVFLFSIIQGKKTQRKKRCRKGRQFSFKLPLYPLTFGSYFYPFVFALMFQTLSLNIFFFSSRKKKNHREEKKIQKKERAYL
jgi:uncharacterized membrane protein